MKDIKCTECSNIYSGRRANKNARCPSCRKAHNKKRINKWLKERRDTGRCQKCSNDRLDFSSLCIDCWCESILRTSLGLRIPEVKSLTSTLLEKLRQQDFLCHYTRLPLIPGMNASIEHIKPRSLYPHLIADPDNLVWVRLEINKMRSNLPFSVFVNFCKLCATSPSILELCNDESDYRVVAV